MNWKNLILGIIYFILLFSSFLYYISYFVPATPPTITEDALGTMIQTSVVPNLIKWVIALVISTLIPLLIIFLVKIDRINTFLKPKKWKIIPTILIAVPILFLTYAKNLNLFPISYNLVKYLTFNSTVVFSGFFEFMEVVFPIMIYYLIVCSIYTIINKNKKK